MGGAAVGTDALEHEIDRSDAESFGQRYLGGADVLEAEHAFASLAVEVSVHVARRAVVLAVAQLVLHDAASVFERMYERMFVQQAEHAQYARALEGAERRLKLHEAHRGGCRVQGPEHKDAVRGRLYAGCVKNG